MNDLDLRAIRRQRLQQLIDERFNGSQADFAVAAKRSPTQVNHWLSGYRNPNGDTCRKVEDVLKLSRDWLDQPYATTPAQPGNLSGSPGIRIDATGTVQGVDTSIETIAQALAQMTDAQRETMAGKLASLARAPDSPTLKKSISASLGSAPLPPPDPE